MEKALVHIFNKLQLEKTGDDEEEKLQLLARYLDELISHDFNKLISILYRVDVSEEKAKIALANKTKNETDGHTLAKLLIAREREKLKWREQFKKKS